MAITGNEQVIQNGDSSPLPSMEGREVVAVCPEGKTVTGGGFTNNSWGNGLVVTRSEARLDGSGKPDGWKVTVVNTSGSSINPTFSARAICSDCGDC